MSDSPQTEIEQFAWLVNNFVQDVPGVAHAVVVSSDGLLLAVSDELDGDRAERLSAVASGMLSLAHGASRMFDHGAFEQTIVRMEQGFLFLTTIAEGCCFVVITRSRCDMQVVAYQMSLFVEKAGHVLTPQLRGQLRAAATY